MNLLQSNELINRVLLILGAYSFSIPVVSLIHEIGHILAMMSVGITQYILVINPFTESSATPLVPLPAEHLLYLSVSGMIFQTVVFVVIGALVWRSRSVLMCPLMMCLPMSMINVGSYLLMGAIVEGSDVVMMTEAGVPPMLIQIFGLVTLMFGLWSFTRLLPVAGFKQNDSRASVFLPLFIGTGLYSFTMLMYGYLSGYGTMIGVINVISSFITGVVYTWIFKKSKIPLEFNTPSSLDSYKVLGIGLTAVFLCFLIF